MNGQCLILTKGNLSKKQLGNCVQANHTHGASSLSLAPLQTGLCLPHRGNPRKIATTMAML